MNQADQAAAREWVVAPEMAPAGMRGPLRVLVVEDEPLYGGLVQRKLARSRSVQFEVIHSLTLADGVDQLRRGRFDALLLDLTLPDSEGIRTVQWAREAAPDVPLVVLTGLGDEAMAVEALHAGAQDYLVKGTDEDLIGRSLWYAVERRHTRAALRRSEEHLQATRQQLLQVEKMDSVGRLAADLSHEVRNPLAILQMGVGLLRRHLPTGDHEVGETLDDMNGAVERVCTIVRDLLDFCSPTEPEWKPVNLNDPIGDVTRMVRHELLKRDIALHLDLAPDLPPLLLDKGKIRQVFLNLLMNAMDATPAGGRITITTASTPLAGDDHGTSAQPGERLVHAEVRDTGCGIPVEALPRVFDPFFTAKAPGQGTGLGLSIARAIVEQHGGSIRLRNRREGGASATVLFAA